MDDDRLLSSLRRIAEPVEPPQVFLDRLYETLADELGFRGEPAIGTVPWRARLGRPRSRWARRIAWLAAAALLVLAVLGGAALLGALLERQQAPVPPAFRDVTMYRADPERSGVQPGPGPSGDPVLIWAAKADGPILFNPVLAAGVLYVGSDDGYLYALDARTGAKRWSFDAGAAVQNSAVVTDGLVAVADATSMLHVIDAGTGAERWRAPGIVDVGNVAHGIIYTDGADHQVHGYELQAGTERWSWQAPDPVLYVTVVGDTAYVTSGGTLHAIGLADRAERWHYVTPGTQASIATVAGDKVLVSTREGTAELAALDRATGSPGWTVPGPSGALITVGSIRDDVVYAPTKGAGFYALAAADGRHLWHVDTGSIFRATPVVEDTIYAPVDDPGGVVALRASDGAKLWNRDLGGPMQGWPIVSGGFVFTTDATGEIHAYGDASMAGPLGPVTVATPINRRAESSTNQPSAPPNPFTVVSTLDPTTTGLVGAADMDVGPDGNIYVVDFRPRVSVISPTGELLRRWGKAGAGEGEFDFDVPSLGGAAQIAVGHDGLVYVSDGNNRRVQVFKPDGTFVRKFGSAGPGEGQLLVAWDLGVDETGNVYVIDGAQSALSKFDRRGKFVWRVGGAGDSDLDLRNLVHGVKFGPDGHVWIANDAGRIVALDTDGHKVDAFGEPGSRLGQLAGPCGLNVDKAGNLYVYNCVGGRIQVFDPDHALTGIWDAPAYDARQSFAFAPDGRMFGLGQDDTILKIEVKIR